MPRFYQAGLLWLLFGGILLQADIAFAISDAQQCGEALAKPLAEQKAVLPTRLRVFIWNIKKTENKGWQEDLATLAAGNELLLIQEAYVDSSIHKALAEPMHRSFAVGYVSAGHSTGVLTLSSVQPSLHCQLSSSEPWFGTPKATNITEYPITGDKNRLLVINLHAVNFTVGLRYFKQQITALTPLLKKHHGPLLVAGDFNTWSSERLNFVKNFMQKYYLVPVQFKPDHRKRFFDQPLDQVYLRNLNLVEGTTVKVESSDHNPLLLTLEIPQCSVNCIASLLPSCVQC